MVETAASPATMLDPTRLAGAGISGDGEALAPQPKRHSVRAERLRVVAMLDIADLEAVELRAQSVFGDYARQWLSKPNRSLAQLSPYELAKSPAGARLVLAELEQAVVNEVREPAARC
jgi:hypothetical protein